MDSPKNTLGIHPDDEDEIEALVSDFRTLCGVQLPGDYSSDAALQAAMIYWHTRKMSRPPMIRVVDQLKPDDVKPGTVQFRERTIP